VYIPENCGILDNLVAGDLILANRGFSIHDSAGLYCAEVKLPPFTKGKKQLSKAQVDLSHQLSRVCIHIERVIGVVRQKYTSLQSTRLLTLLCVLSYTKIMSLIKLLPYVVQCVICAPQLYHLIKTILNNIQYNNNNNNVH